MTTIGLYDIGKSHDPGIQQEPRANAGARTAASEWSIPQVRKQVRRLLSQVYRLLFGDAFLEFERKYSCNEGGVTLTPPDDGFRLGGAGPWDDWCTFTL